MECPSCGEIVGAEARFCPSCGHALRTPTDERRIVTVVFADLVGFTGLSESRDPEQVKNLVDECFGRLASDVTSFGGRVDKIVGDAVLALFGAPVAHEDDAERGVRAALQMQRTLGRWTAESGVDVRMRVGVTTGEVLVGALRAGGDYTAMGDVVNIANRLQSAAPPGGVVIGRMTFDSTRYCLRTEPLGAISARGREAPVEAWLVLEAVGLPGHRPVRTRTPLIGRGPELRMLEDALANTVAKRRPHVALVVAETGMGTSRLGDEVGALARDSYGALVLEGRCVPYGEANVWWPVAEALRQSCSIYATDSAEVSAGKCLASVADMLGLADDRPEAKRIADGLMYLMGYDVSLRNVDPSRARDEAVRALHIGLEAMGTRSPVVLVLSDVHWADALVLDLVDRVLDRLRNVPLLLIATARPEIHDRWAPKPGRHNVTVLHLDPLDQASMAQLLGALCECEPAAALRDALIERSGGNPFFLEELVALLTQSGGMGPGAEDELADRELPETLRGLVAARLDGLPAAQRMLLDDAAVIGRSGRLTVLSALADARGASDVKAAIDGLAARDFLVVDRREWSFRSDVIREVAYATLTKAERARRHANLAMWQERIATERGRQPEYVDAVAHHYARAAELAAELGPVDGVADDIGDRALAALDRTAAIAEWRELPQAVHLLGHALRLVPDDNPGLRWQLLLRRARSRIGGARDLAGARADATLVLDEASAAADEVARAGALTVMGQVEKEEEDLDASLATLHDAVSIWRGLGDRKGTAEALRALGMTCLFCGQLETAQRSLDEALDLFRDLRDARGAAWALQNAAWIAFKRGDADEAEEWLRESADTFLELGDLGGYGWALGLLGWVRLTQGRLQEAEAIAEEVLQGAREVGNSWGAAMMLTLLADVRLSQGRVCETIERSREAVELFRSFGDHWGEVQALAPLARGLVAVGEVDEGLRVADEAVELSRTGADPSLRFMSRHLAASIGVLVGRPERVLGDVRAAGRPAGMVEPDEKSPESWAAMALVQMGRAREALELVGPPSEDEQAHGATLAPDEGEHTGKASSLASVARAFVYAANEMPDAAVAVGERALASPFATRHDRAFATIARGLAYAQMGRTAESDAAFEGAAQIADATDDRLAQALTRLAHAAALRHGSSPRAAGTLADARSRLAGVEIDVASWETAFAMALGAADGVHEIPRRVAVGSVDDGPSEGV